MFAMPFYFTVDIGFASYSNLILNKVWFIYTPMAVFRAFDLIWDHLIWDHFQFAFQFHFISSNASPLSSLVGISILHCRQKTNAVYVPMLQFHISKFPVLCLLANSLPEHAVAKSGRAGFSLCITLHFCANTSHHVTFQ